MSAIFIPLSHNSKTGPVAVTYASIASTCPDTCALKNKGCYAQDGWTAMHVKRLDAVPSTPLETARLEASLIDAAIPEGQPLRLHVSGDARTVQAALVLANASQRWTARGGGPVWTYTHAWRVVPRRAWGTVSVLASVESSSEASAARAKGYAPARIVEHHPLSGRAYEKDNVRWIPCPAQTRGVQCVDCRLCFDADGLRARKAGITFAVHGSRRSRAALRVVDDEGRLF